MVRRITKSSSHWSRSKNPLSSHLSQAFRTPGGIKTKKSIRQTEKREGENVIDWDEDLGCLAVLNLSLPLTSSTLCLHLFLSSAWLLLSLPSHLLPLCSHAKHFYRFLSRYLQQSRQTITCPFRLKQGGWGRQSNISQSGIWYPSGLFTQQTGRLWPFISASVKLKNEVSTTRPPPQSPE